MIDYNSLYNEAKNTLSDRRFIHSEGVVSRAIEYAEVYGVDVEKVKLVAIAHDIAKEKSVDEAIQYGVELDEIEKHNNNLVHAKFGAEICKREYGFSDEMVNAVKYHTTGRADMPLFEKIIYLADATESNRDYESEYYVNLSKTDIDKAVFEVCKWTMEHLIEQNRIIHPDSLMCYNYYADKIK